MSTIAAVLAATPSPSPTSTVPDVDVTPGVAGFIAIALVAVVTILLLVDMTRRIRRTRYRSEIRERLEAESNGTAADGTAADGTPADGPAADADGAVTDEPERRAAEDGRADVGDDTERG